MKTKLKIPQAMPLSRSSRWIAAGISLLMILVFVGALWIWPQNNLLINILFGLVVAGVIYLIASRFIQLQSEMLSLQSRMVEVESNAAAVSRKANAVLELSRRFVEANEESEVISSLLNVFIDLVDALGASVVPLDERGMPLTAISSGEIPDPLMNDWAEYLASPEVRNSCAACQKTGMLVKNCPLVEFQVFESREEVKPVNVYCLHLRRGERDFGVLNLYLPERDGLPESSQEFMQALLDEAALVLESIRLRNRELSVIEQLRNQTDLKILEMDFIENVKEALKADFVLLQYRGGQEQNPRIVRKGDLPEAKMTIIDSLIDNVSTSELPILLGEVDGDPGLVQGVRSIIAVPLTVPDEPAMGVIVVGNYGSHKFNSRHLALLQTLSGQISLVIKNSRLQAETEFKIIISERKRLAREIHDGLAQTLGFLKLQTAQMENLLVANERDRLQESLSTTYRVLSEAYIEVRQAIDGLRISPNGEGLASWVKDTCLEFEDNTGLMVDIEGFSGKENLPLEVQLQLVRIIQEALSNVRKHACAKQAWVSYYQTNEEAIIDIRDDGRGFSPEDIPGVSRYGLQGMRERTELIGGEFQVISQVDKGTTIRVRVPIIAEE